MRLDLQRVCMMVASVALLGAAPHDAGGMSPAAGIIVLLLYIVPTVVAFSRHAQKRREAAALSLLLGFLIVPWIITLIWAFGPTAEEQALQEKQRALAQQQQDDAHTAAMGLCVKISNPSTREAWFCERAKRVTSPLKPTK